MRQIVNTADGGRQVAEYASVVVGGRERDVRHEVRLCLACGKRSALFSYRGVVKADCDHNLCFECYRAEANRLRARLAMPGAWTPMAIVVPTRSKMVGDRAGLMLDLQARRRRAQISARRALDAPEPPPAAEALAS